MKISPALQSILAGVGVCSLLIYVLACATSFSPDDRQVLYPSFDPQSGATAVACYDRQTGRSEILFTAGAVDTNRQPALLRAEWLPDGKHVLVADAAGDDNLELLVLPRGVNEPVRHFSLPKTSGAAASLEFPFAIAGAQLFLNRDGQNPLRLNLVTGGIAGGEKATNEVIVLPSPDGKSLIAFRDLKENRGTEFGTFDPQTMEFKVLGNAGTNVADDSLPAFNPADGRLMVVCKAGEKLQIQVTKNGATVFSRALEHPGGKLETGPFLDAAPDGKTVLTAYRAELAATTNVEYGLLEIPLNSAPLRFTPLLTATNSEDSDLIFAQPSLSHDGKTWAIASTFLYLQNESLKPEDCAFFLVDVSKPNRPVTKVPIQLPAERKRLVK